VAVSVLVALGAACANNTARCEAPSSGTFSLSLAFSQTLPVSVYCPSSSSQVATCSAPAQSWTGTLTVDASGASLASGADAGNASWTCEAVSPDSPSNDTEDGGAPQSSCYLLVSCNQQAPGGIGPVQFQLFAQGSSPDVLALVQDSSGDCCVNEYTGTWN
jgi:hypothetical protein